MTKSETKLVGQLITIGIVLSPFVWVYHQVGGVGLGIVLALLCGAIVGWNYLKRKSDQHAFDELALYMLHTWLSQDEVKQVFAAARKTGFDRLDVVRNLKVLRESVHICLTSKKRQTAEGRMEAVEECYAALQGKYRHSVSDHVLDEVVRIVEETREQFKKMLFLNVAKGHVEKAASLKTAKSKLKYLALAREVLEEGLDDNENDADLHQALVHVYRMSEALGRQAGS